MPGIKLIGMPQKTSLSNAVSTGSREDPVRVLLGALEYNGSLWHKGAYNTFRAWKPPIPYATKNKQGASKIPPNGAMGFLFQGAGSLWHKRAGIATL